MSYDSEPLTTPLECPLCHETFDHDEGFERHLRGDHSTDDFVEFVFTYLEEQDQEGWG